MVKKYFYRLRYKNRENEDMILRDHLALERTRMANERTFLAYFKTSVVMFGTGIALVKVDILADFYGLGHFFVFGAPILLLFGIFQTLRIRRRIIKYYTTEDQED